MTNRFKHHVTLYCKQYGYALLPPSKSDRTILVYETGKAFNKCLAEGTTWSDIAKQLAHIKP